MSPKVQQQGTPGKFPAEKTQRNKDLYDIFSRSVILYDCSSYSLGSSEPFRITDEMRAAYALKLSQDFLTRISTRKNDLAFKFKTWKVKKHLYYFFYTRCICINEK